VISKLGDLKTQIHLYPQDYNFHKGSKVRKICFEEQNRNNGKISFLVQILRYLSNTEPMVKKKQRCWFCEKKTKYNPARQSSNKNYCGVFRSSPSFFSTRLISFKNIKIGL
jgi:hypothetical protein